MLSSIALFSRQKLLWISLAVVLAIGFLSNYLFAAAAFFIFLVIQNKEKRYLYLLIMFLLSCILAGNLSAFYSFADNLRFVVLGTGAALIIFSLKLPRYPTIYLVPFTIIALISSLVFSGTGVLALARSLAFILTILFIFGAYRKIYENYGEVVNDLILGFLTLFLLLNAITVPVFNSEFYLAGRFRGIMGNPNELGLLCLFCYGIYDMIYRREQSTLSSKSLTLMKLILFAIIIVTGSRTALFGVILYEIVYRLINNKVKILLSIIVFGFLFYLSLMIDPILLIEQLGLSGQLRVESLATGSGRTEVWKVAWQEILANPVFGKGMMYDNYFIEQYVSENPDLTRARYWGGIWSSYLSLWLNVGLIGLVAYLYFVYKMFRRSVEKRAALAFLAMTLFAGITESWMVASLNAFTPLFYLYWAIQSQLSEPQPYS